MNPVPRRTSLTTAAPAAMRAGPITSRSAHATMTFQRGENTQAVTHSHPTRAEAAGTCAIPAITFRHDDAQRRDPRTRPTSYRRNHCG